MRIAFVADPLSSFKIYKDSTYAMMVEAAKRGHELYFVPQEGLMWKGGRVTGETSRLTLTGDKDPWYRTVPPKETPLAEFRRGAHAQGPAVRHRVRREHLASGARAKGRREGVQRPARDPDHSEKAGDREIPAILPADAGDAARRATPAVHRRERRRGAQAARRNGRSIGISRRLGRS